MREINEAFEALRRAVPHLAVDAHNEKLTKITTLRLAMKYISALSGLLTAAPSAQSSSSPNSAAEAAAIVAATTTICGGGISGGGGLVGTAAMSSSSAPLLTTTDHLAALGCCLSPSTSDDVDSLLSEYASDLLCGGGGGSECSSAASTVGFLADHHHHSAAFLRDLPGAAATYSLSPSSCSTSATDVVGFPSPLLSADFPVDVAAAFMPFADHPLPPIDFNGDPYMFEDNFACTEFS